MLVPAMILWSNLHGGYPLGLLLIGAAAGGQVLNHLLGRDGALPWRGIARMLGWGALAYLAAGINPNGARTWLIPFQTVNVGVLQQFIQEWASPDFHELAAQPFLWLLFAAFGAMALSRKPVDGVDLVTLILFAYLALVARRNFGPFALAAAPVLARSLAAVLAEWRAGIRLPEGVTAFLQKRAAGARGDLRPGIAKALNLMIVSLIALAAIVKLAVVNHPVLIGSQLRAAYPVEAVERLGQETDGGRIFNAYNWGGYLMWALPGVPVYVDGRTDLYGDEILGEWVRVVQASEGWQAVLDRRAVRRVLLEPDRPVTRLLAEHGWQLLAQGEGYVLSGR
jgi:hypothetical protein